MTTTTLGILHLTDLHAGQRAHDDIYPHMREGFLDDLAKCHAKSGPWDIVVFSGDLAFSGKKKEYEIVEKFLHDLYVRLEALDSNGPLLIAVPGNHDLSRPTDATSSVVAALASLSDMAPERAGRYWDGVVKNANSDSRKAIKEIFANYSRWWESRLKTNRSRFSSLTLGLLPGEFEATIEKNGCRFGIVGLNSTFMQVNGDDFRGKLQMHVQQLNQLFNGDLERLQSVDAAILITHHPPDWLDEANRTRVFLPLIAKSGRFAAHLCGHMHVAKAEATSRGASVARRIFLGRSLLAQEETLDGLDRLLGYQALQIRIDSTLRDGFVRCWPRMVTNTQSNDWKFVADTSFELDEDEGTPEAQGMFPRPNWKAAPPTNRGRARAPEPDPLFKIYSKENERYYLVRDVDTQLKTALSTGSVWVSGASGVGKTAALKHCGLSAGRLQQIDLARHEDKSAIGQFRAMCVQVASKPPPPPRHAAAPRLMAFFIRMLRRLARDQAATVLIDEIHIDPGPEFTSFLKLVLELSAHVAKDPILRKRLCMAFCSINDPAPNIGKGIKTIRKHVRLMPLEVWQHSEIRRLVDLIAAAVRPSLSAADRDQIAAAAQGSPTYVKRVFGRWRDETASGMPLRHLLMKVSAGQL